MALLPTQRKHSEARLLDEMVLETGNGGRHRPLCARHLLVAPCVGRGHVLACGRQRGGARRHRVHPRLVRLRGLARARPRAHRPALWYPYPRYHPAAHRGRVPTGADTGRSASGRSEEHTSELQSPCNLVCRLLLEKKKNKRACYSLRLSAPLCSCPHLHACSYSQRSRSNEAPLTP